MTETTNQAGNVETYSGKKTFSTTQTRYGAIQNQMRLSLADRMEAHKMCLSFCYAGRNGHCASAGKDNRQVEICLTSFGNIPFQERAQHERTSDRWLTRLQKRCR